uniref:Peptidyl-prolyl cis-trans isomerase n=1 Tax=Sinocyclocheilus grahami TaxID=75366 RepID=A0A672QBP3_SINGR
MTSTVHLEIVGLLNKHNFQIAKSIAEKLNKHLFTKAIRSKVRHLLIIYCSLVWQYSGCLMSFGNERKLSSWAEKEWKFSFHQPQALYKALAEEYYTSNLRSTGNTFVYMDIESRGEAFGRLLFELFSDVCPKTCKNFKTLCSGEAGLSKSNLELSYKGSIFHRVLPNGWLQGGGNKKGIGGESIYGPTFEGTEFNFVVSHNKRGILGMVNQGAHSNSSQFYITLQPTSWMVHKYVAFGQLVEGTEVLKRLEAVPTYNEVPKQDCKIAACGVFEP